MSESPGRLVLVAAVAAAVTLALALGARRARLGDAPRGAEAARKRQRGAVPCVGGLAILVALLFATEAPWRPEAWPALARLWPAPAVVVGTLVLVLAVGLLDDHRPLGPAAKALATGIAFAPMGVAMGLQGGSGVDWAVGLGWALWACAVAHVLNTWDNADGALAGLVGLGALSVVPALAAACAGFLPFNLDAGRRSNRSRRAPTAYLGDGGSFALGFLVAASPQAWGLVWLPALDLARLSVLRWASGSRPWIGDRRHLAHRLEARGLGPVGVAAVLAGLAAPAALGVPAALARDSIAGVLLALAGTGLAFGATLRFTAPAP